MSFNSKNVSPKTDRNHQRCKNSTRMRIVIYLSKCDKDLLVYVAFV